MKTLFLIVTLPAVLAACATQSSQSALLPAAEPQMAQSQPAQKSKVLTRASVSQEDKSEQDESIPSAELTPELLYKLLTAEIAFQRGDWQTGYVTTLAAAQQTRDPRLARRAAEMALTVKHPEEALDAVRLWRALAPDSDEAQQYYLGFVILSDNLAEARPILEQRLREARPQTRSLMVFQIQRLLSRAKDKAAAYTLLQDVLKPYANLPEAHLALAQSAFTNGQPTQAREEAETALKIKPDSELAVLSLAQILPEKADAAKALSNFLARYPKARDVRTAYARMLVDQKEYAKARNEFVIVLKEQPEDLTALFASGILSMQLNDTAAAEKYLTTYLKGLSAQPDEDRDPTQALMILAQIAEDRKDNEGALRWLSQIEPGEGYFGAQIKRAQITAKMGNLQHGRDMLHEIDATGEREQAQISIAEAQMLRDANKNGEALKVLETAVKRYPENTDLLYDYAMAAEKNNQIDVMETALRKIMRIAPDNQHAYNALGYSLAERNIRLQEAHDLVAKALQLAPEDPYIMDSMGWVQFRMGKLKEAEALLRRAYELRPDAEIAVHLGEVLWTKGRKDDAQKFWRDARSKDPQNDTLKSTLARLNVNL